MKPLRYVPGGPPVKLKRTKKLQTIIVETNGLTSPILHGKIVKEVQVDRTKMKHIKLKKSLG